MSGEWGFGTSLVEGLPSGLAVSELLARRMKLAV